MAISTIAAVLEQKVWLTTFKNLYPNLYVMIVGHPGMGKTNAIVIAKTLLMKLAEFHLAPVSLTWASLVDALVEAKRYIIRPMDIEKEIKYNSMFICADELGAFIHKYDDEMTKGLSAMYDPTPYSQNRRTSSIKIKMDSPQINMLTGSTPQDLLKMLPENAWGQGFMSRVIMIFSDERRITDDFAEAVLPKTDDLMADLEMINGLWGQFHVTEAYRTAVNDWQALGEPPVLGHPKLTHYNTRRRINLYKLSMIAAVDKSNALVLTKDEFNTAMGWLLEAECYMEEIFKAGNANADGQAMDEILHFIMLTDRGKGVSEHAITRFARDRVPLHSILRIVEILERSGQIVDLGLDRRTNVRYYSKTKPLAESLA